MDIFVARQPIFLKNKNVAAYELLFRDSMENFMPADQDGDRATSSVLSRSFMNLGFDAVSGGKKVFINFTENLLIKQIPTLFPPERTIIEILENVKPTPQVLEACRELKNKGYSLALDDFIFDMEMAPFFELADIIKVDFMGVPLETIKLKISSIPRNIKLLAEKVETWEEFRAGIDMGFVLFQGYFFSKPEIIKGKELSASTTALIQIVSETNKSDPDLDKIVSIVSKEVMISYKLLSLINSAYFKRLVEITTIRQALNYLGQIEFRRFISVILMANLAKESTMELAVISCLRARFCELIAEKAGKKSPEAFTLGLFSLIDAMLGKTMEAVMDMLPLSKDIKNALILKDGPLFQFLLVAIEFEKGNFIAVEKLAIELHINYDEIPGIYKDSVAWADILSPV